MTLDTSIYSLLGPLVGGECYPNKTGPNPAYPLIIYQGVGGVAIDFLDQSAAPDDNARVQVIIWSRTKLEASALAKQVRDVLLGSSMRVKTMAAAISMSNHLLDLYGSRQDFSIWYPRT